MALAVSPSTLARPPGDEAPEHGIQIVRIAERAKADRLIHDPCDAHHQKCRGQRQHRSGQSSPAHKRRSTGPGKTAARDASEPERACLMREEGARCRETWQTPFCRAVALREIWSDDDVGLLRRSQIRAGMLIFLLGRVEPVMCRKPGGKRWRRPLRPLQLPQGHAHCGTAKPVVCYGDCGRIPPRNDGFDHAPFGLDELRVAVAGQESRVALRLEG
jgi:hypothetical protein